MTAETWDGVKYKPVSVDIVIGEKERKVKLGGTDFLFIHIPGHTPGSMAVVVVDDGKKVLFPQDVHGPFLKEFNSNIDDWAKSMKYLLSLECDILAEGHYGIYNGKLKVKKFIKSQLSQNNR